MGLFSWLRRKQKEAETPTLEAYTSGVAPTYPPEGVWEPKPFKLKAIMSNGTITVYCRGNIYSETGVDKVFYDRVIACTSEDEVRALFVVPEPPKPVVEDENSFMEDPEADAELVKDIPELVESGEFEQDGESLYLAGVKLSLPKVLARELHKAAKEETPDRYNALKNFWYWCTQNPDARAREDLFPFLVRAGFKITANGNFLGRRAVRKVSKEAPNKGLTEFITTQWLKIKKNKKSPKNYQVVTAATDSGYTLLGENPSTAGRIGNLNDLYQNLSSIEDNEYTDGYTGKMRIVIGEEVSMERGKCNSNPHETCSAGLHVANYGYNIAGNGDTVILVAVNPMNVVAVPYEYGNGKLRTCAYMPLAVVENDTEALSILKDGDAIDLEDKYFEDQLGVLEEKAKNATGLVEVADHKITAKEFITEVVNALEEGRKSIAGRVVEVI